MAALRGIRIYLDTETVGQHFATRGVIRDAATDEVLDRSPIDRPYGFVHNATEDARELATRRGYVILNDEGI